MKVLLIVLAALAVQTKASDLYTDANSEIEQIENHARIAAQQFFEAHTRDQDKWALTRENVDRAKAIFQDELNEYRDIALYRAVFYDWLERMVERSGE